ncbi:hypothetical protein DM01DRAFT_1333489 [Hesseltinella vesiculosa]|uniref:histone acetyltransferase n=1 Tax=Hesseltinella vesiculosa TaxID=101127 RepID=A0A1X2GQ37_9FUNG|nr:hypothetical protein DM01DRAFT_1333489 [Hesseltinella vesiculosa]
MATSLTQRLIMVASKTNETLLCGMEIDEYTTMDKQQPAQHTVYVSKIDTSGSPLSRGVAKRLVIAYLTSLPPSTKIHVFARAQPQYLFAKSARHPDKHVLSDRQLVRWWHQVLTKVPAHKRHWCVPGVDDPWTAQADVGLPRTNASSTAWHYGHAYSGTALAQDVIPRFPDDGKGRFLSSLADPDLTVDDYWALLGFSEECGAGHLVGIFVVELAKEETKKEEPASAAEPARCLDEDTYTQMWNDLMHQDFSSGQSNHTSTHTWLKAWHKQFYSFAVNPDKPETLDGTGKITPPPADQSHVNTLMPRSASTAVHVLSAKRPTKPDAKVLQPSDPRAQDATHLLTPKRKSPTKDPAMANAALHVLTPKRKRTTQ